MSAVESFFSSRVSRHVNTLNFMKEGVSGICVRRPGQLDGDFYVAVQDALKSFGIITPVISPSGALANFSFMTEPAFYVGRFSFVKGRKVPSIRSEVYLCNRTARMVHQRMNDSLRSVFFGDAYDRSVTDIAYLVMVSHRNWTPEDIILPALSKQFNAEYRDEMEDISGSGGYRLISALFIHESS